MTAMPRVVISEDLCKGCELCISVCPRKLILLSHRFNVKSYHFACIDPENEQECTGCGACALICPDVAIELFGDIKKGPSIEV